MAVGAFVFEPITLRIGIITSTDQLDGRAQKQAVRVGERLRDGGLAAVRSGGSLKNAKSEAE